MAESSAYLASHWAESWFQREGSRIAAELLVPEGLSVTSAPEGMGESAFIPAGKYGYAFYNARQSSVYLMRRFRKPPYYRGDSVYLGLTALSSLSRSRTICC